jgi:transcriptional regulator with XRE-family HTH domain
MQKKIEIIVEKTRTGYSAFAKKDAVYTTGQTLDELKKNILEAVNFSKNKRGKPLTEKNIKITLDIVQFFEFYKVINAKAFSERIGMNQSLLAQYINGIKKPSVQQTYRIIQGIKQVGNELSALQFIS